jgi:hypothetical protein
MALEKYEGPGEIYVNGRLQAEARKCTVTVNSNDNPVNTMRKGFAGFSDGPTSSEASVESAIPKAGYETDFVDHVSNKRDVVLVVKSGARRHRFEGRFTNTSWSNATDETAMITGSFVGGGPKTLGG